MAYQTIILEIDAPLAVLTFNRPDKLNALNEEMLREFSQVLEDIRVNPAIRALILTGQGRAFIAGADVRQFLEFDSRRAYEFIRRGQDALKKLEALEIPVIAAVNGFALGGGCEMALACDLIYASENAKFGQPEINLGLMPGLGGSQRLARLVGKVWPRKCASPAGRWMPTRPRPWVWRPRSSRRKHYWRNAAELPKIWLSRADLP